MADVGRHPNIKILTNTDIKSVEGEAGNFTVMVTRRPRYVNEDLCVGCRTCASYCPYKLPNPFDENLSDVKAIDIWCPQAVPAVSAVDREACLYFQNKCKICIPVCKADAIDFTQKRKKGIARVGAIIVTTGYDIFDAAHIGGYGYGKWKNVVNSMEFERLLNASGPHKGQLLRPSDGKIPKKIAWLQCVGSRDKRQGHTYCSSVCCTSAVKQVILAKNHYPDTRITVFHNGIRTYGKGFEDLYDRAKKIEGIRFVHNRIPAIEEHRENSNLVIEYFMDSHNIQEEFDMVVLSIGMSPGRDNGSVARIMGLDLNEHNFCKTDDFLPNEIPPRPGIFPAATFTGPMDIPDSISSATGAVSLAAQLLSGQRGTSTKAKVFPQERSLEQEEPKIGVFVCHCGNNIAGVADVPSLVRHASTLENVVYCQDQMISCAPDSCRQIAETIKEKGINRVVVTACSPRDHESGFQETLREGGLNQYLLEIANIREHCTWVHSQDREEATQKAKDLISMSVAKARNLGPLEEIELPVNHNGLVLGGGIAGMKAALSLAMQGFKVYLVEKEEALGGNLKHLHYTMEGSRIQAYLKNVINEVESQKNIKIFRGYELEHFSGFVGNFKSTLAKISPGGEGEMSDSASIDLDHGIIIVATGGKLLKPIEYRYGESKKIVTQQQCEEMIISDAAANNLRQVVMIQCVGARDEARPYCSRICCGEAIKNALKLKQLNEDVEILIFHREIRTYGFREDYYALAREKGISFIPYEPGREPEVEIKGEDVCLSFYDSVLEMEGKITPDLLVLSTPVVTEGNRELARILRVPVREDGFFMEAHMKLRPLDFTTEGIFLCGMAQYPKYIPETISQANGAAARAVTILSKDRISSSGAICKTDAALCNGCGLCEKVCPYGAIGLRNSLGGEKATVISALCKGCGVCSATCPTGAIIHNSFTDRQILSQIDAAYSVPMKKPEPKIIAFLCHWCGYAGADLAGVSRIPYASNIRVIRVMCSGRIHPAFIYEAFLRGMDAVLVVGCHLVDCHYISGINETVKMVRSAHKVLGKMGIDPERLRLDYVSSAEGAKFAEVVNGFTGAISRLGLMDLKAEQKERLLKLRLRKMRSALSAANTINDRSVPKQEQFL